MNPNHPVGVSKHEDKYQQAPRIDGMIGPFQYDEVRPYKANVPEPHRPGNRRAPQRPTLYHHPYYPVSPQSIHPQDVGGSAPPLVDTPARRQSMPVQQLGPQEIRLSYATYPGVLGYMHPVFDLNHYVGTGVEANDTAQGRNWLPVAPGWGNDDPSSGTWNELNSMSQVSFDSSYYLSGRHPEPMFSDHLQTEPEQMWDAGTGPSSEPITATRAKTYLCLLVRCSDRSGRRLTTDGHGASELPSDICGERCREPKDFVNHLKVVHKISNNKRGTEYTNCAWGDCNSTMTQGSYHRHVVEVHGRIRRHRGSNE